MITLSWCAKAALLAAAQFKLANEVFVTHRGVAGRAYDESISSAGTLTFSIPDEYEFSELPADVVQAKIQALVLRAAPIEFIEKILAENYELKRAISGLVDASFAGALTRASMLVGK